MNYTFPPAKYLIPADLKRSTIRRRNTVKEEQIERAGMLQHYWLQRTPQCELLGIRELKKLTVIDRPISEFIEQAPNELIYCEGFGHDRYAALAFFIDHYEQSVITETSQFYITEWYPVSRRVDMRFP